MHPDVYRTLAAVTIVVFFSGCADGPPISPYHAPSPSQPFANLIILPSDVLSRNASERVDARDTQCSSNGEQGSKTMNLGKWDLLSEAKPVQVALPAGRAYLRYVNNENTESCAISFSAKMEAGHVYALHARKEFQGWLKGSSCFVSLFDMNSKSPISLDYESAEAVFQPSCNKPAGL